MKASRGGALSGGLDFLPDGINYFFKNMAMKHNLFLPVMTMGWDWLCQRKNPTN